MKIAVLWDIDGTLADSEPLHGAALVMALRSFGISAQSSDELLGACRPDVYKHLVASYNKMPDYETYAAAVDSYYIANIAQVGPMPAAVAACRQFAGEGRRQMAVSNSDPQIVDATLRSIGVYDLLHGVIARDAKGRPKPSPDPYRRALEQLEVQPHQAIAYEDSQVGCASARAAGLFVVGVSAEASNIGAHVHYPEVPNLAPEALIASCRTN